MRYRSLCQQESRPHVECKLPIKRFERRLKEGLWLKQTGRVDDDVKPAEGLDRFLHETVRLLIGCEIMRDHMRVTALRLDAFGDAVELRFLTP